MPASDRAKYADGVLTPLDPLDLEEGAEVSIEENDDDVLSVESDPPSGGGFAAIVRMVEEFHKDMPPDAWDDLPTDLAMNKKHSTKPIVPATAEHPTAAPRARFFGGSGLSRSQRRSGTRSS